MAKNFVTKNFMSPDEAFEKIYGAGAPGAQDGKYMSPDEAFAKIYGNGDSQEMEEAETITPESGGGRGDNASIGGRPWEGLIPSLTPRNRVERLKEGGLGQKIAGNAQKHDPSLPEWSIWKALRGGTADVAGREADVVAMNDEQIKHVVKRDIADVYAGRQMDSGMLGDMPGDVSAAPVAPNDMLSMVERAAILRNKSIGDDKLLHGIQGERAALKSGLEKAQAVIDPGAYNMPASAGGQLVHDVFRAVPYTAMSALQQIPLALLTGPAGTGLGSALSAALESQMEQADVYGELRKRGMNHEDAYRASQKALATNMAMLPLSNYAQTSVATGFGRALAAAQAGRAEGGLSKGIAKALGNETARKIIESKAGRFFAPIVLDAIGEGSEESLQGGISSTALGDPIDKSALAYEGLVGAAMGAMFGGAGALSERARFGGQAQSNLEWQKIRDRAEANKSNERAAVEVKAWPPVSPARVMEEVRRTFNEIRAIPAGERTASDMADLESARRVMEAYTAGEHGRAEAMARKSFDFSGLADKAEAGPIAARERVASELAIPVRETRQADVDMRAFARIRDRFVKDFRRYGDMDIETLQGDERHHAALVRVAADAYQQGDFQRTANILAYLYGKSEEVGGSSEPIAAKERATSELAVPTRKVDADHAYVGKPQPVSGGYQIEKTDGTKVYVPEAIFGDYYQVTPRAHQPVPESKRVVNGYAVGDVFQSADGGAYWVTKVGAKGITLTDGAGKSRNVSMGTMAKSKLVRLSPEHRGDTHYSLAPGYSRTPLYGVEGEEVGVRFAGTRADAAESVKPYEENISGRKQIREEMPVEKAPERVVEGAVANESAGNDSKSDVEDYAAEKVVNGTPSREYKYYLHARPAGPGAVPNGLTRIDAKDGGGRHGAVYYDRELSAKEVSDYELVPAEGGIQKEGVPAKNGLVVNGKPEAEEVKPAELSAFTVAKKSPVRRVSEKQRTAAGKRVQENARKASDMQGYHTDGAGRQVFTDTRAVFRLSKPVEGLEAADANATWPAKVEPLFEHVKKEESVELGREEIAEMVERGKRVRGKRAADVPEIITKVGQAYVDSTRLGEVLSVLGTDEVTVYTSKPVAGESGRRYYSNVYFSSANGEALLAPVHLGDAEARAVDSYYKDAATAVRSEAKAAEGSGEETGADKTAGARKAEKGKGERQLDKEYLAAVEVGDMETAQKMVDEAAARKGYAPEADYRSTHQAPSRADADVTLSLEQMRNGESMVPGDFFTHPEYYMDVNDPVTRESLGKFRKALAEGGKLTVYRSVLDKGNKEGAPRNGDWVSLSRRYAQRHGESVGNGKYSVQEIEAGVADLFWDGNDVNELGYDDGESYAYRNTKNNRKLLDAVTRDDKGQVIPLSKRFNKAKADTHYRLGKKPQYVAKAEVEAFVSGLTPGKANIKAVDPKLILKTNKMSPNEMLALSVKEVERLGKTDIVTPLGEKVYFAPGNTEDLKAYTLHLIAGMDKSLSEIRRGRVYGLFTAEETLKDPLVILRQDNGRTFYVSLYDTKSGNMMNGIIVGVEEGQNGRVVTSIIQLDKSRTGNKAIRELKKHIRNAKDVLYLWKGQSGHPRPPTDQHGSMPDVGLPMSGEDNVAQNSISDKIRKNSQQDLQAGLVGAGGQPVESLFDSVKSAGALVNERAGLPPLSVADVAARVKGAKVSGIDDGKMKLEFSNGTAWIVDTQAEAITADPEVVARDYGRELRPGESVVGRTLVIDGQRFIDMVAGMSDGQTFSHEVFEAAWDSLTKDEQAAVLKTHGNRENAAERYGEFLEGRVGKLTKRTQVIFQRMRDFFYAIRASLFGKNSEDVFREVASGKVLNREAGAVADQEHYRLARKATAEESVLYERSVYSDALKEAGMESSAAAFVARDEVPPSRDGQRWHRDDSRKLERVVQPSTLDESVRDKAARAKANFYRLWIDKLDPLKKRFGVGVYHVAENAIYGAQSRAARRFEVGDPSKGVKGLLEIFKDVPVNEQEGLSTYAVYRHFFDIASRSEAMEAEARRLADLAAAKRVEITEDKNLPSPDRDSLTEYNKRIASMRAEHDLYQKQAETLRSLVKQTRGRAEAYGTAVREMESHYPHWVTKQQELAKYNQALLKMLNDGGIVSDELYDHLKRTYPNYVPLQRDFGTESEVEGFVAGSGLVNVANPLKKMKGSTRDVIDPLNQIVSNTFAYESVIARQKVGAEIMKRYDEGMYHDLIAEVEDRHHAPDEMVFHVWDKGKKRLFKADADIYEALVPRRRARWEDNPIAWASKAAARTLRAGTTHGLTFGLRNPFRDTFNYGVVGENFRPVIDTVRGFLFAMNHDAGGVYDQFMAHGGAQGMTSLSRDQHRVLMEKMRSDKGTVLAESMKNPVKAVWDLIGAFSELGEQASRLGQFERAMAAGYSAEESAAIARDNMNFMRSGVIGEVINQHVPFWNAAVQGTDKMLRTYFKDGHINKSALVRSLLYITVPSMMATFWNYSDDDRRERYLDLPAWRRNTFWNFVVGKGGPVVSIPKPFEIGMVFGSLPERIIDYAYANDKRAFDGFKNSLVEALSPEMYPLAPLLLFELSSNYSKFYGRPIVPQREQRLEPAMQYGPYTAEWAKFIGRHMNVSPRMLEYAVFGLGGGLAKEVSNVSDGVFRFFSGETRPAKPFYTTAPGLRGFFSTGGGRTEEAFRSELEVLQKKLASAETVYKTQGYSAMTERQKDIMRQKARIKAMGRLSTARGGLQDIYRHIREIPMARGMSGEEKMARIEALEERIRLRSKRGLAAIDGVYERLDRR